MICLDCDSIDFSAKQSRILQEFRGERFEVETAAMVCDICGFVSLNTMQLDELRRKTADAYRRAHQLMTGDEIREFRNKCGMSQVEFAEFLGVGEASVKRWETWLVQNKSSDELIRSKTNGFYEI